MPPAPYTKKTEVTVSDRTLLSYRLDAGPQRPVTRCVPRVPSLQMLIARSQWSSDDRTLNPSIRSFPVSIQRRLFTTRHIRSCSTGHMQRPVTQRLPYVLPRQLDRTQPSSVRSETDASVLQLSTDRTRRSNRGQRPVTYNDLCLFCIGRRWHRRTLRR